MSPAQERVKIQYLKWRARYQAQGLLLTSRFVAVSGVSKNDLDWMPAAGEPRSIEHLIQDLIETSKLSVGLHPQINLTEF